jgi:AcrR family transcriptional regulator
MIETSTSRPYRKTKRAEQEAATRRAIVEATLQLHREVGPARTTISAIAQRAGVQRLTVYRHFPDETELLGACGAAFIEQDPPPDPSPWSAIDDPHQRITTALSAIYAWYRRNADMLANTERDAPLMPQLAAVADPTAYRRAATTVLLGHGKQRRGPRAAIGHALEFTTWRSLTTGQHLTDTEAATLMTALVTASRTDNA